MLIARNQSDIALDLTPGTCVTIGNFDGVHKGHQELINRIIHQARIKGLLSAAITFDPHPLRVLVGPRTPPFITVLHRKLELLATMGLNMTVVLEFTRAMAALAPEEFVKRYLVDMLHMKELVVGYDYSFGKGRKGNFESLSELGLKYGYDVERLDPVIINDAIVSSTRIRDMIRAGDVWGARPLLGRFYVLRGPVIKGRDRGGRLLGFPTANLSPENELVPQCGVYVVWAQVEADYYPAVVNIGYNPTFNNEQMSIEAHLLDFSGDLYDSHLRLHFVQRLRGEKKFSGIEELIARIKEDIALGRRILAAPDAQL